MSKLPVTVGFIFPNGRLLETGGRGHCKTAMRYIMENNLVNEFNQYNGAEDDFLIEQLGAAKVAQCLGNFYLFLPKGHGWYLEEIKWIYRKAGYTIKYCHKLLAYEGIENRYSPNDYNRTVCQKVKTDGKIVYTYNPNRIGD